MVERLFNSARLILPECRGPDLTVRLRPDNGVLAIDGLAREQLEIREDHALGRNRPP